MHAIRLYGSAIPEFIEFCSAEEGASPSHDLALEIDPVIVHFQIFIMKRTSHRDISFLWCRHTASWPMGGDVVSFAAMEVPRLRRMRSFVNT